jgi:hypothetical protein
MKMKYNDEAVSVLYSVAMYPSVAFDNSGCGA